MASDDEAAKIRYANALRDAREERGLTQKDLAELVGVSPAYISQLEPGRTHPAPSRSASAQLHARLTDVLGEAFTAGLTSADERGRRQSTSGGFHASGSRQARPAEAAMAWRRLEHAAGAEDAEAMAGQLATLVDRDGPAPVKAALDLVQVFTGIDQANLLTAATAARMIWDRVGRIDTPVDQVLRAITQMASWDDSRMANADQLVQLIEETARVTGDDPPDHLRRIVELARTMVEAPDQQPSMTVAYLEPGPVRHVWLNAVALDPTGLWINPASGLVRGSDRLDPKVQRDAEGRLWVSTGAMDPMPLARRDPSIHTLPALHAYALPGEPLALGSYERTALLIPDPTGPTLTVQRGTPDTIGGTFPSGINVIHVLTAANPSGRLLPPAENTRRHTDLLARATPLRATAPPAEGWSAPDTAQLPAEDSEATPSAGAPTERTIVLYDVDEPLVKALAEEFDQSMFFRWTPETRAIVTLDGTVVEHPWSSSSSQPPRAGEPAA